MKKDGLANNIKYLLFYKLIIIINERDKISNFIGDLFHDSCFNIYVLQLYCYLHVPTQIRRFSAYDGPSIIVRELYCFSNC